MQSIHKLNPDVSGLGSGEILVLVLAPVLTHLFCFFQSNSFLGIFLLFEQVIRYYFLIVCSCVLLGVFSCLPSHLHFHVSLNFSLQTKVFLIIPFLFSLLSGLFLINLYLQVMG